MYLLLEPKISTRSCERLYNVARYFPESDILNELFPHFADIIWFFQFNPILFSLLILLLYILLEYTVDFHTNCAYVIVQSLFMQENL